MLPDAVFCGKILSCKVNVCVVASPMLDMIVIEQRDTFFLVPGNKKVGDAETRARYVQDFSQNMCCYHFFENAEGSTRSDRASESDLCLAEREVCP